MDLPDHLREAAVLADDGVGEGEQLLPGLRQDPLLLRPVEEGEPQLVFHPGDGVADGGFRQVQPVRGQRQVFAFGNGGERRVIGKCHNISPKRSTERVRRGKGDRPEGMRCFHYM